MKIISSRNYFYILFVFPCLAGDLSGQSSVPREDYAVYSTVLRNLYREDTVTYLDCCEFVILENTRADSEVVDTVDARKYRILLNDFKRRNVVPGRIEKKLPFQIYHLVDVAMVDKLFSEGKELYEKAKANLKPNQRLLGTEYWIPFYTKYPHSAGLHSLSKVGFDRKRSLALVNVKFGSNLFGFSRMYILKKKRGVWSIQSWAGSESID